MFSLNWLHLFRDSGVWLFIFWGILFHFAIFNWKITFLSPKVFAGGRRCYRHKIEQNPTHCSGYADFDDAAYHCRPGHLSAQEYCWEVDLPVLSGHRRAPLDIFRSAWSNGQVIFVDVFVYVHIYVLSVRIIFKIRVAIKYSFSDPCFSNRFYLLNHLSFWNTMKSFLNFKHRWIKKLAGKFSCAFIVLFS